MTEVQSEADEKKNCGKMTWSAAIPGELNKK